MANGHGGKREGGGRKPVSEELNTRQLAQNAIIKKFGNLENGLTYLLDSGEPTLLKFAYEHAYGKPIDKVMNSDSEGNLIKAMPTDELEARLKVLKNIVG